MLGEGSQDQLSLLALLPPSAAVLYLGRTFDPPPEYSDASFAGWYEAASHSDRWLALSTSLADERGVPSIYDPETQGNMLGRLRDFLYTLVDGEHMDEDGLTTANAHFLFAAAQLAEHQAADPFALYEFCNLLDQRLRLPQVGERRNYLLDRIMHDAPGDDVYSFSAATETLLDSLAARYQQQAIDYRRYGPDYADPAVERQIEQLRSELTAGQRALRSTGERSVAQPDQLVVEDTRLLMDAAQTAREHLSRIIVDIEALVEHGRQSGTENSRLIPLGPETTQASRTPAHPIEVILQQYPNLARSAQTRSDELARYLRALYTNCRDRIDPAFFSLVPPYTIDPIDERFIALEGFEALLRERQTVAEAQLPALNQRIERQANSLSEALRGVDRPVHEQITQVINRVGSALLGVDSRSLQYLPTEHALRLEGATHKLARVIVARALGVTRQSRQNTGTLDREAEVLFTETDD